MQNLSFTTYTHTQWAQTAVYHASANGHSEVVKLLVQAGADLELQHKVIYSSHGNIIQVSYTYQPSQIFQDYPELVTSVPDSQRSVA